jgi:hypothetical protein
MRSEIIERIATYRDIISKRDRYIGAAIGNLLMLLVNQHYELADRIEKLEKKDEISGMDEEKQRIPEDT